MDGAELIAFLRGRKDLRAPMMAALGADPERCCVYYLCPLSTLRLIAQGGILPHVSAPAGRTDLSGSGVQSRREGEINFGMGHKRQLHECVNFFWNPLNQTSYAFQRRALVVEQKTKNPDDGVVCILEMDLESLTQENGCYCVTTPGNYAQFPFAAFSSKVYAGDHKGKGGEPLFRWQGIFSTNQADDSKYANSRRSAEFIVSLRNGLLNKASRPIAFQHVHRVLVPDDTVRKLTTEQLAFLAGMGRPFTRHTSSGAITIFYRPDVLLEVDRRLLDGLKARNAVDPGTFDKLKAGFTAIYLFERKFPQFSPTPDKFIDEDAAFGHHGAAHATRVMFWCAFLAQYLPEDGRAQVLEPLLAAAAIHDTRRTTDAGDDTVHGDHAAAHFAAAVNGAFPEAFARSCLAAVAAHCRPDDAAPAQDTIWRLLKDADALDRGRFDWPGKPGGCDVAQLRDPVLKADAKLHLPWAAFNIARVSRHLGVDSTPCENLLTSVYGGMLAFADIAKKA